jgi:hypothetical protein
MFVSELLWFVWVVSKSCETGDFFGSMCIIWGEFLVHDGGGRWRVAWIERHTF